MSRLLRVGDTVINLATVADIQMKLGGEVHVHFLGPVDDTQIPVNRLELRGQEAEALRRWIGSEVQYCEGSGGKQDEAAKSSEPPQAPPLRIPQGPPPQDSYSRFGRVLWAFGCEAGYYTQESQAAALRRVGYLGRQKGYKQETHSSLLRPEDPRIPASFWVSVVRAFRLRPEQERELWRAYLEMGRAVAPRGGERA